MERTRDRTDRTAAAFSIFPIPPAPGPVRRYLAARPRRLSIRVIAARGLSALAIRWSGSRWGFSRGVLSFSRVRYTSQYISDGFTALRWCCARGKEDHTRARPRIIIISRGGTRRAWCRAIKGKSLRAIRPGVFFAKRITISREIYTRTPPVPAVTRFSTIIDDNSGGTAAVSAA